MRRTEADPIRGICGTHGGYETAEVRDIKDVLETNSSWRVQG